MENKNYLNEQDYTKMMKSWYVVRSINPRFPFWKDDAERMKAKLNDKTEFVIRDNVPYWVIGYPYEELTYRPVPEDIFFFAYFLGMDVNIEKYRKVYDEYTKKTIEDYRRSHANRKYSMEEIYEMKSAFGEGKTIVDVFTGKIIAL